jgi:hypothetical protein
MVAVPVDAAVTSPEASTLATERLVLLQTPPEVASVSVIGSCGQFVATPVIPEIDTMILTVVVVKQPVGSV